MALSLDKELPVYSRRFLHTRWSRNRYFDDIYVASKHIIEADHLGIIFANEVRIENGSLPIEAL